MSIPITHVRPSPPKPKRGTVSDARAEHVYRAFLNVFEEADGATQLDLISAVMGIACWEDLPPTVKTFARRLAKELDQ